MIVAILKVILEEQGASVDYKGVHGAAEVAEFFCSTTQARALILDSLELEIDSSGEMSRIHRDDHNIYVTWNFENKIWRECWFFLSRSY